LSITGPDRLLPNTANSIAENITVEGAAECERWIECHPNDHRTSIAGLFRLTNTGSMSVRSLDQWSANPMEAQPGNAAAS
jgi:hypothetical protein